MINKEELDKAIRYLNKHLPINPKNTISICFRDGGKKTARILAKQVYSTGKIHISNPNLIIKKGTINFEIKNEKED